MKIENWRRHLKKMRNGHYEVDGVVGRFIRYRFIGNKSVLIELSTRKYEFDNDDVPYKLANWRPINDKERTTYDHIASEQQLQDAIQNAPVVESEEVPHNETPGDNVGIDVQTLNTTLPAAEQSTILETMETQYAHILDAKIQSALFTNKKLEETIMRLKGDKGKDFVGQAKQIVNAINATSKIWTDLNEFFKTGVSLQKAQNKSNQQNPKDGKTGNDRQED